LINISCQFVSSFKEKENNEMLQVSKDTLAYNEARHVDVDGMEKKRLMTIRNAKAEIHRRV
jgi:hypothetical protein